MIESIQTTLKQENGIALSETNISIYCEKKYKNQHNDKIVIMIDNDINYIDSDNDSNRVVLYVDENNKKYVVSYDTFIRDYRTLKDRK